jgi:alpha-N-acetylglucosamine transferase
LHPFLGGADPKPPYRSDLKTAIARNILEIPGGNRVTMKKYSFVSILTTDDYLDGVLVLKYSLDKTNSKYPFLLLVTPNLSESVISSLTRHNVDFAGIKKIENPSLVSDPQLKRWNFTYSKLNIFGLTQFDKIVYLDADMLILKNIDDLFDKPHMSAVNMAGKLPELSTWNPLNAGLLVVEPSVETFNDMTSKIGAIEKIKSPGDEDFLQAYYPEWPNQTELHLDSGYNMFSYYWHRYNRMYGYSFSSNIKPIKVVHYIGEDKPWRLYRTYRQMSLGQTVYQFLRRRLKYPELRKLHEANCLWFKQYRELTQSWTNR